MDFRVMLSIHHLSIPVIFVLPSSMCILCFMCPLCASSDEVYFMCFLLFSSNLFKLNNNKKNYLSRKTRMTSFWLPFNWAFKQIPSTLADLLCEMLSKQRKVNCLSTQSKDRLLANLRQLKTSAFIVRLVSH